MRAMQFEEADGAAAVAERDEILAQDAQPPRQVAQFARTGRPAARSAADIRRRACPGRPGSAPRPPPAARDGGRRDRTY